MHTTAIGMIWVGVGIAAWIILAFANDYVRQHTTGRVVAFVAGGVILAWLAVAELLGVV